MNGSSRSALSPNELIGGRYRTIRLIGEGGSSCVYEAEDSTTGDRVALKVLHQELSETLSAERFRREVELMRSLESPTILPLLDAGVDGGRFFCTMRLVRGETLGTRLDRDRQLSLADTVRVVEAVGRALSVAHQHRIVHRDVKPDNILLERDTIWLGDFGIARAIIESGGERLTQSGIVVGTPLYMSPEQSAGDVAVDARSDQYSLACVAYECLAGVPPFRGATPQVISRQRLLAPPQDIRVFRAVPAPVADVLTRAMSPTPADRYETVSAFVTAFADACLTPSVPTGEPGATVPAPSRAPRRRWVLAAAAVLLIAGIGGLLAFVRGPRVRPDSLQFTTISIDSGTGFSASEFEQSLEIAARSWKGVSVLPSSNNRQHATAVLDASDRPALRIAIRVVGTGDSIVATLDVRPSNARTVTGLPSLHWSRAASVAAISRDIIDAVVLRALISDAPSPPRSVGVRDLAVVRAVERFDRTLAAWDLRGARGALEADAALSASHPAVRLRRAELRFWETPSWSPRTGDDAPLQQAAASVLRDSTSLSPDDRLAAMGLYQLSVREYPAACAAFDALARRDSARVLALVGAGECRRRDRRVVRAGRDYVFRGSTSAAVRAYAAALTRQPLIARGFGGDGVWALPSVLLADPLALRGGSDSAGARYVGVPVLSADTLAIRVLPMSQFLEGVGVPPAAATRAARAHAVRLLAEVATAWVAADSLDPDPHAALAWALEASGAILPTLGTRSAAAEIVRARALARDSVRALELGATAVRLALKMRDFPRALAIADSLLRQGSFARGRAARVLAPLAALLGRDTLTASLLERADVAGTAGLSDHVRQIYANGVAFLALSNGPPAEEWARRAMAEGLSPMLMSTLCAAASLSWNGGTPTALHRAPECRNAWLVDAQIAASAGEAAKARALIRDGWRRRGGPLDRTTTPDVVAAEVALLAHLGDTAAASCRRETTLEHLDEQSNSLLSEVLLAAGMYRLMAQSQPLTGAADRRVVGSGIATSRGAACSAGLGGG